MKRISELKNALLTSLWSAMGENLTLQNKNKSHVFNPHEKLTLS